MPRLLLPALAAAGALAVAAPAGAATFPQGVAGDATSTTVRLWTRAVRPGRLLLKVSASSRLREPTLVRRVRARAARGNAVTVTVRHLQPGRPYFFRFFRGRSRSPLGRFETTPSPRARPNLRFAVTGAIDPGFDPKLGVLRRIAGARNDFNVLLGGVVPSAAATTLPGKRRLYRAALAQPAYRALRARAGLYATWGAGEFAADFAPVGRAGRDLYRVGARTFAEHMPVVSRPGIGLYRTIRWGRTVELFLLDERSFRSAQANGSPSCTNPSTGRIDPAPTMPRQQRNDYGGLFGPLQAPVDPACTATIADRSRTLLGRRQLGRFLSDLARSKARFNIVLSEAPFAQTYLLPYDRWEGYAAERERILAKARDIADNVLFVSAGAGDVVGDVRLRTLEPPGVAGTGFSELSTGPAASTPWYQRFESVVGGGTADAAQRYWLRRFPPYGAGMRCAQTSVLSYAEIQVTSTRIRFVLNDAAGHPVSDGADGTPCGPFTLVAGGDIHKPS